MDRRSWITLSFALLAGCSGTTKGKTRKKPHRQAGKRPKGPKTMGNLLLDSYITDLKQGTVKSQISAAKELGNMGASAKSALPALQALTNHADAKLSTAAKEAIQSIKK